MWWHLFGGSGYGSSAYLLKTIVLRAVDRANPQIVFMVIMMLQLIGRGLFFLIVPLHFEVDSAGCHSAADSCDIEGVFGTLPAILFVVAFSILVGTYAGIFHLVVVGAGFSMRFHTLAHRVVMATLVLMNTALVCTVTYQYVLTADGTASACLKTPDVIKQSIIQLVIYTTLIVRDGLAVEWQGLGGVGGFNLSHNDRILLFFLLLYRDQGAMFAAYCVLLYIDFMRLLEGRNMLLSSTPGQQAEAGLGMPFHICNVIFIVGVLPWVILSTLGHHTFRVDVCVDT
jgi:hypothetical protein